MINLDDRSIILNGETQGIKRFEVWFVGVDGIHTTLEEALKDCEKNQVPSNMLRPVSVAIGTHGTYEIFMR
jgi:hypothetical protein